VSGDDFWTKGQSSVQEDVAKALAPGARRCPACGHTESGGSRTCSRCGAELVSRAPRRDRPRPGRSRLLILGAVAAAAIGSFVVVVSGLRDDAARGRAAADAQARALVAAEERRLRADARPQRAAGPRRRAGEGALAHRARLVAAARRRVTRDARERVRGGTVRGPIAGTDCRPYPATAGRRAAEADPATARGRYDCTAIDGTFAAPELEGAERTGLTGQPYWVVIDYGRATLTWCKVTPRAGEGGAVLAHVPVPVPCRDPER
jgi:hypothetical protein